MTIKPFYPFHKELEQLAEAAAFSHGNFGLWYNKLIPNIGPASKDSWCACDKKGDKNGRTEFYKTIYDKIKKNRTVDKLLEKKHCMQMHYIECMEKLGFLSCAFSGTLETALITGLGETHPSETSLVLDHTLGIPYIPASGIKGAVRFSHSKGLLFDNEGNFTDDFVKETDIKGCGKLVLDEANMATHIPLFFGGDVKNTDSKAIDKLRGSIIFFDAYPTAVPELHTDIINPHYSNYYGDNKPPGDYQEPVPVKFLTMAPETSFIFRFLLDTESVAHKGIFFQAVKNTLQKEGIGAKTAIGYGRFKNISEQVPGLIKDAFDNYLKSILSEKEKQDKEINELIAQINQAEKGNASVIDMLFSQWQSKDFMARHTGVARAFIAKVGKEKSNGQLTKQYAIVSDILGVTSEKETENIKAISPIKKPDKSIVIKLEAIIKRGYCVKKEKKKILKKYKEDYPDLYTEIKKLPKI